MSSRVRWRSLDEFERRKWKCTARLHGTLCGMNAIARPMAPGLSGSWRETHGGSCGNHEHMEEVRKDIERML